MSSSSSSTASLTAVSYVGDGVIVLAVLWTVGIILILSTAFLRGPLGFAPAVIFLLFGAVSLILIFMPRSSQTTTVDVNLYDYFSLARIILLSFLSLFALIGVCCLYTTHGSPMIRAKKLENKKKTS